MYEGKQSPWGKIDICREIAPGIYRVSTPSHGGFKLDAKHNRQMPAAFRQAGGWYEEDCLWSFVPLIFPQHFDEKTRKAADQTAKDWYPNQYESHFKVTLHANESSTRREQIFQVVNKFNWVVVCAWGDWKEGVPKGFVGVCATQGGVRSTSAKAQEERYFFVPNDEYKQRNSLGFVIDLDRHQSCPKIG